MKKTGKTAWAAVAMVKGVAALIICDILIDMKIITGIPAVVAAVVSFVLFVWAVFYVVRVDYETGVYECRNCGHVFKPEFKAYIIGSHTMKRRKLRCPECNEKSWCVRKIAEK